jgi:molecular chaperone GrpE
MNSNTLERREDLGQPFDPARHDAVSQRTDPAQAEATILEVVQHGYQHGDRVIRPAKVVVNILTPSHPVRHVR